MENTNKNKDLNKIQRYRVYKLKFPRYRETCHWYAMVGGEEYFKGYFRSTAFRWSNP